MIEFFLALIVVAVLIAGMAVGVLLGRKPLAGSCGGMSALGMEVACDICGGDTAICEEVQSEEKGNSGGQDYHAAPNLNYDLAYDASQKQHHQE